jgi:hypothetical protein
MPEGGLKTSIVSVVWATFGIFSAWSKWFLVGRDWWPWTKLGYITMTRRQTNNQWSGGIGAHPAPKNSECKNPLENFSPRLFEIKKASSSLIIFQRAKLSKQSITHLCWCNWRTFWRKGAAGSSQRCSCSCTPIPAVTVALACQKKLAYLGFHCLDHPPYSPDLAPSDYHLFSGLKNNWKFANFRPTRRSLLLRRPGWRDKFLIFFVEWLAKVRATG